MLVDDILLEISALQNEDTKKSYLRFFKSETTDKSEFLGVKIPLIRALSKKYYKKLSSSQIEKILQNKYHEIRYFALSCFVLRVKNNKESEEIEKIYLKNLEYINNWDLIDISAPYILKNTKETTILELVKSNNLWVRRIGILSQLANIRSGKFKFFIKIAEILINDNEDLIQKPIGWLLREIGKVDLAVLENFLEKFANNMARVALRYAIEKFDKEEKQKYLKIKKV